MQFLKDQHNKTSAMRVGLVACLLVGAVMCLAGSVAVFYSLSGASALVTAGAGLMGSSGWAKAIQKRYETNAN